VDPHGGQADGGDVEHTNWLREQYLAAQLAGDRRAAVRLIVDQGLGRGLALVSLYLDVIQAAQHVIGELWQQNRITVATEHVATAVSQVALAELYRALIREPANGRRALVACVAGELHELGPRMTADFLEMAGFDVRYAGANVPTDALVATVREHAPDLLVVSVSTAPYLDALRLALLQVRDAVGNGLNIAVGGQAFTWVPVPPVEVGADMYGRDAPETVATARRALGITPT
jgi:methanogenic corrinoid protein MtbC1